MPASGVGFGCHWARHLLCLELSLQYLYSQRRRWCQRVRSKGATSAKRRAHVLLLALCGRYPDVPHVPHSALHDSRSLEAPSPWNSIPGPSWRKNHPSHVQRKAPEMASECQPSYSHRLLCLSLSWRRIDRSGERRAQSNSARTNLV